MAEKLGTVRQDPDLNGLLFTIFVRFDVAYGAPAQREGVQPEEGGTPQVHPRAPRNGLQSQFKPS